jgi:hypothetical protein
VQFLAHDCIIAFIKVDLEVPAIVRCLAGLLNSGFGQLQHIAEST